MRKSKTSKFRSDKQVPCTEVWKRRIKAEKGYSDAIVERIAGRLESLAKYMQYGHAIIAYHKQDGTFQLATGTLISYPREFKHPYNMQDVHSAFIYWSMEAEGWRTFQIENFLEWKPIV